MGLDTAAHCIAGILYSIIGSDLKLWVDGLPISSRVTGGTKVLTDANTCALFEFQSVINTLWSS